MVRYVFQKLFRMQYQGIKRKVFSGALLEKFLFELSLHVIYATSEKRLSGWVKRAFKSNVFILINTNMKVNSNKGRI